MKAQKIEDVSIVQQLRNDRPVTAQQSEKDENVIFSIINNRKIDCNVIHVSSEQVEGNIKEKNLDVKRKWSPNFLEPEKINWKGVTLALAGAVFLTIYSVGLRASRGIGTMELLLIYSLMLVVTYLPLAFYRGESLLGPKGLRIMLMLQGIFGGLSVIMRFYSLRLLPLGDATALFFSSVVVVMIISSIFLKEFCGFFRIIIVSSLLVGVVLISKPPFLFNTAENQSYNVSGYVSAILGTVFHGLYFVMRRKYNDVHYSVQFLQMSVCPLIVATSIVISNQNFGLPKDNIEWCFVVTMVTFGLLTQIVTAKALCVEEAGRVAIIRCFDVVLAYLLQVYLFGEKPDYLSITGAVLIVLSVIVDLVK